MKGVEKVVSYCEEELFYFTKPTTDFDCLPRETQIIIFVEFLLNSGNSCFNEGDIVNLFEKVQLKNPRTDKFILPTSEKIKQFIERLILKGKLPIINDGENYKLIQNKYDGGNLYKFLRKK